MSNKRTRSEPRERRSPTQTLANLTDDLMAELNIPELPDQVPQRLAEALTARVEAFLYRLREAGGRRLVRALEARLVRDAHQAVLTAYELHLPDAEVYYAQFRRALEELGYERTDVGFRRTDDTD